MKTNEVMTGLTKDDILLHNIYGDLDEIEGSLKKIKESLHCCDCKDNDRMKRILAKIQKDVIEIEKLIEVDLKMYPEIV